MNFRHLLGCDTIVTSYLCNKYRPITLFYLFSAEYLEIGHLKYLAFIQDHVASINNSSSFKPEIFPD